MGLSVHLLPSRLGQTAACQCRRYTQMHSLNAPVWLLEPWTIVPRGSCATERCVLGCSQLREALLHVAALLAGTRAPAHVCSRLQHICCNKPASSKSKDMQLVKPGAVHSTRAPVHSSKWQQNNRLPRRSMRAAQKAQTSMLTSTPACKPLALCVSESCAHASVACATLGRTLHGACEQRRAQHATATAQFPSRCHRHVPARSCSKRTPAGESKAMEKDNSETGSLCLKQLRCLLLHLLSARLPSQAHSTHCRQYVDLQGEPPRSVACCTCLHEPLPRRCKDRWARLGRTVRRATEENAANSTAKSAVGDHVLPGASAELGPARQLVSRSHGQTCAGARSGCGPQGQRDSPGLAVSPGQAALGLRHVLGEGVLHALASQTAAQATDVRAGASRRRRAPRLLRPPCSPRCLPAAETWKKNDASSGGLAGRSSAVGRSRPPLEMQSCRWGVWVASRARSACGLSRAVVCGEVSCATRD